MTDETFSTLVGKTLERVTQVGSDRVVFDVLGGGSYALYHSQDCCESVDLHDVAGDFADLVGSPILFAEESTSNTNPPDYTPDYQDSFTWTFYRIGTVKGTVVMRWIGESNGYYSESVDFASV